VGRGGMVIVHVGVGARLRVALGVWLFV
jgi:hypothetical protein